MKIENDSDGGWQIVDDNGTVLAYLSEEIAKAVCVQAVLMEGYIRLQEENEHLRAALTTIAEWRLPATGRKWDDGREMSYGACYGSWGERDYMRKVATDALNAKAAPRGDSE